jgi:hypothetical protein
LRGKHITEKHTSVIVVTSEPDFTIDFHGRHSPVTATGITTKQPATLADNTASEASYKGMPQKQLVTKAAFLWRLYF